MKAFSLGVSASLYRHLARPVFFHLEPEAVHDRLTGLGCWLGQKEWLGSLISRAWRVEDAALKAEWWGITFDNPIGLAAGFDYQARLPQVLPAIGFGFGTMGTFTRRPCEGNPPPRLGRRVPAQSLFVNKGFRNPGIETVLARWSRRPFSLPIGLSIGRHNRADLTLARAVDEVAAAFVRAERSSVRHQYYELNISCPNLAGSLNFYNLNNLSLLLRAVTNLQLRRPLLIKMPIHLPDSEVLKLMETIVKYPVAGVILGNLKKEKGEVGGLSGRPTFARSNELIKLAYRHFGEQLKIVGCGGVFNAADAYHKIKAGASLVQLVTGLIFEGPQLPGQINAGLVELIKKDGLANYTQAIGTEAYA